MKVALVLWSGQLGGAEAFTRDLATAISAAGHEPTIVFLAGDGHPLAADLDRACVPWVTLGGQTLPHLATRSRALGRILLDVGRDGTLLARPGYWALLARAGGYDGVLVAIEHGGLLQSARLSRFRKLVRSAERWWGGKHLDAEVAVSDFMLDAMRRWPHAERLLRIYNGIDAARFAGASSVEAKAGLRVAAAGRHIPGKGFDVLIKAVDLLVRDRIDVRCTIAGDGPESPRLAALAERLGLGDRVVFPGAVGDMAAFWGACDVAVVPSTTWIESFGLVAVEALASGRPVLVSANGALPEVVDDEQHVLPVGDPSALAQALASYADRSRADEDAATLRKSSVRFDIRHSAAQYLDLLEELRAARSGSARSSRT